MKFPIFLQSNIVGPKKEQVGECVTGLHFTHQHQSLQEECRSLEEKPPNNSTVFVHVW